MQKHRTETEKMHSNDKQYHASRVALSVYIQKPCLSTTRTTYYYYFLLLHTTTTTTLLLYCCYILLLLYYFIVTATTLLLLLYYYCLAAETTEFVWPHLKEELTGRLLRLGQDVLTDKIPSYC